MSRSNLSGLVIDTGSPPAYPLGTPSVPVSVDTAGRLVIASGGGSFVFAGSHTPADNYPNPTDAVDAIALMAGWDGATWDRIRALAAADGITNPSLGALVSLGFSMLYNGADWDRARSAVPGDAIANPANGAQLGTAMPLLYDGGAWRRQRGTPLDGTVLSTTAYGLNTAALLYGRMPGSSNGPLQCDDSQRLKIVVQDPDGVQMNAGSPTTGFQVGDNPTGVLKNGAGLLLSFHAFCATDGWVQIHNKATAPSAGEVPVYAFPIDASDPAPSSKTFHVGREWFGPHGTFFSNGIAWGFSSTGATFTSVAPGVGFTLNWNRV